VIPLGATALGIVSIGQAYELATATWLQLAALATARGRSGYDATHASVPT
jgi:hypothetical protein